MIFVLAKGKEIKINTNYHIIVSSFVHDLEVLYRVHTGGITTVPF